MAERDYIRLKNRILGKKKSRIVEVDAAQRLAREARLSGRSERHVMREVDKAYEGELPWIQTAILDDVEPEVRAALARLERTPRDGRPTVVDICSGAGMASLGFEAAGFRTIAGVDLWHPAANSFRLNHPNAAMLEVGVEELLDLAARGVEFPKADVVITGPPCQDDSRCRRARRDLCDLGRGELKIPTLAAALLFDPEYIIMETVSKKYEPILAAEGYMQALQLKDSDLGGHTVRKRFFYVWGPSPLTVPPAHYRDSPGWGPALSAVGIDFSPDALLATDADGVLWRTGPREGMPKRWQEEERDQAGTIIRQRYPRYPHEASRSVVGSGAAFILRDPATYEGDVRLTPGDHASIQGFPGLHLAGDRVRTNNSIVGNGWTRSFGVAIAGAILENWGQHD